MAESKASRGIDRIASLGVEKFGLEHQASRDRPRSFSKPVPTSMCFVRTWKNWRHGSRFRRRGSPRSLRDQAEARTSEGDGKATREITQRGGPTVSTAASATANAARRLAKNSSIWKANCLYARLWPSCSARIACSCISCAGGKTSGRVCQCCPRSPVRQPALSEIEGRSRRRGQFRSARSIWSATIAAPAKSR